MKYASRAIAFVALLVLIASCAPPAKKKEETVFYPPAPELPRIQYLASFTGQQDIKEDSAFATFIVGEEQKQRLDKPYGVGIYDGKIYVCDTNLTVMVFDFKAKSFTPLKGARGAGKLVQPLNITITEDGTKYVTDPVRGQIVVFDKNDEYVRAYGMPGNWKPVDAAPFEDRLYVADVMNGVVKVFDKATGEMIKTIGDKGDTAQRLDRPTNLSFDREGYLYITDVGRFQVVKFDRDGHFVKMIGRLGDGPGMFARPRGLALDRQDRLFAVDAAYNNVQIFNKDGRILMFFGGGGTGPGDMLLPAKVVVDYNNLKYFEQYVKPPFEMNALLIVTSQFGDRLVNVYGYGQEKGQKYPTDEELLKQLEEKRKEELEKLKKAQEQAAPSGEKKASDEKKQPDKEGAGKGENAGAPAGK